MPEPRDFAVNEAVIIRDGSASHDGDAGVIACADDEFYYVQIEGCRPWWPCQGSELERVDE